MRRQSPIGYQNDVVSDLASCKRSVAFKENLRRSSYSTQLSAPNRIKALFHIFAAFYFYEYNNIFFRGYYVYLSATSFKSSLLNSKALQHQIQRCDKLSQNPFIFRAHAVTTQFTIQRSPYITDEVNFSFISRRINAKTPSIENTNKRRKSRIVKNYLNLFAKMVYV